MVDGWQHCLDRWILPNLANKLVSEVGNGALRQFVEILSAAGLAPKTNGWRARTIVTLSGRSC
jgi:hypothetical protein